MRSGDGNLRSMPDLLSEHAARTGERPALICGDRSLTFAQWNLRANQVRSALAALGAGPGDRIAVMSYNGIELAEIYAAVRKLEAVLVPLNYRLKAPEVAHVINDSGCRLVIAEPHHAEVIEAALDGVDDGHHLPRVALPGAEVPTGWLCYRTITDSASAEEPEPGTELVATPTIIYTSGTTGKPKGVYRPDGVSPASMQTYRQLFELTGDDVYLACAPQYHSAGTFMFNLAAWLGNTIVIQPRFLAREAAQLIERHRVTSAFMAPTLIKRINDGIEHGEFTADLSSMRFLLTGAAPCPHSLKVQTARLWGDVLWEFYGSTEAGMNTLMRPEDQLRKPGSCGRPFPGHEIRLLDDEGNEVATGEPGTLYVRSARVAGYYNRADATEAAMRDGFFTVGDVAYRDQDGFYYICDRKIDMIISGGVNIYPAEVEAALFEHPAVAECAVIGIPDEEFGERALALVVPRPGIPVTEAELIAHCDRTIAGYKKPRQVEFRAELPRGADGKMHKRALRERYWQGRDRPV